MSLFFEDRPGAISMKKPLLAKGQMRREHAFICVSHVVTVYTEHHIVKIEVEVGSVGLDGTKKSIQVFFLYFEQAHSSRVPWISHASAKLFLRLRCEWILWKLLCLDDTHC